MKFFKIAYYDYEDSGENWFYSDDSKTEKDFNDAIFGSIKLVLKNENIDFDNENYNKNDLSYFELFFYNEKGYYSWDEKFIQNMKSKGFNYIESDYEIIFEHAFDKITKKNNSIILELSNCCKQRELYPFELRFDKVVYEEDDDDY